MSIPLDTLEAEVLKLPAGARSQLLDPLIASLVRIPAIVTADSGRS
jgi:hypothetical protein